MSFTHTIYESVDQVPSAQWEALTAAEDDLTMDRQLIATIERTMASSYSYATAVVTDEADRPAAVACTWLLQLDLRQYPWLQPFTAHLPRVWRKRLKIGLLFCGLPLPAGQSHLRIAPDFDRSAVIVELTRALRRLAGEHGAGLIVIKEFDDGQCRELQGLSDAGFLRCEIPPRHRIDRGFSSFADYLGELRARYRAQISRSLKKFEAGGFRAVQVHGPHALAEILTDEAHQLYRAVFDRSKYKLEFFPVEFMRELARRFGANASLTCVYREDRLAGFTLGVQSGDIHYNMLSGLDYELNHQGDIYFNLFYHDMDFAWKRGATQIDLGLTSDDFKSRLGTRIEPLYLYIDTTNPLLHWGLKAVSPWAFPPLKSVAPHDVFRTLPVKERSPRPRKRLTPSPASLRPGTLL